VKAATVGQPRRHSFVVDIEVSLGGVVGIGEDGMCRAVADLD